MKNGLNEAITAKVNEPTGVNVATVNEDGRPTSRMVLLKEVNEQGFVFFTNYHSRKGRAIEHNPFVALTFFWPELERSVRIEGKAEKISPEQSDEYFATRPLYQVENWRLGQRSKVRSFLAKSLLAKAALIAANHPLNVPRPPHWGGCLVIPDRIEFWQGRPVVYMTEFVIYTMMDNGKESGYRHKLPKTC